MQQCNMQFMENKIKRHRLKPFLESLFSRSKFVSSINGFVHTLNYIFFLPNNFLFQFFNTRRIICTPILHDIKYKSPFKRKLAFISLERNLLMLCTCTSLFSRANDAKIVRTREAQCNSGESPSFSFASKNDTP